MIRCGSCSEEMTGYSIQELKNDGWVFHPYGTGNQFVMCESCEKRYAQRREDAKAAELAGTTGGDG